MIKGEFVKTEDGKIWKTTMYDGGDYNDQDAWFIEDASGDLYAWPVEEKKLRKADSFEAELAGFEV